MNAADVIRYALGFAGKVGAGDPDEYVGQALLAYWKACTRIKSGIIIPDKPEAYLYATIKGTCKHTLHTSCRHNHVGYDAVPDSKISYNIDYTGELLEALKLDAYEQQIVDMRLQGLNDREISEILGKANSTIAKARAKIAERLEVILERS